jgi:hypothetical protein
MIMHPESLYALQRQQHAHLIRQAELDRLARAIRQRRPSLLSLSLDPPIDLGVVVGWTGEMPLCAGRI